jgi:hydroxymethylbilane synthase
MTVPAVLRLGTRKSPMAMAQSGLVAEAITARTGCQVELVGVTTHGDVSKAQLAQIGGTGVFVGALRDRLLSGSVDLAVHSLKDLPTGQPEDIVLAAVPRRDDPRDALVTRDGAKLADLPAGAVIGTGSPRRAAQLMLLRKDVHCVPIRGNADTRLGKVTTGELDAVVLAAAGLARIGRLDAASQVFEPDDMLPAPGQGALAVECRASDPQLAKLLSAVDDALSRAAVTAERAVLASLEAGCSAPIGAYAAGTAEHLHLEAAVIAADGQQALRERGAAAPGDAAQLGRAVAARLLRSGAGSLMTVPPVRTINGKDAL